jgi:plasmid stabilization system protein ParE
VAEEITLRILATVEQLAAFPLSGKPRRVAGTRELVISNTSFLAAYNVEQNRIVVLAIYHGAQKWPEELG